MTQELFEILCSRRSVSPKRLACPGPSARDLRMMVEASSHSPDHAGIRPWRFIEIPFDKREDVAAIFVSERKRKQGKINAQELLHEHDKACSAPTLIVVCACLQLTHPKVPVTEQFVAIGAAVQGFLLCAHLLGYGGIILSGDRARIPQLGFALNLSENEAVVGFISLGTVLDKPPDRHVPLSENLYQIWRGSDASVDALV